MARPDNKMVTIVVLIGLLIILAGSLLQRSWNTTPAGDSDSPPVAPQPTEIAEPLPDIDADAPDEQIPYKTLRVTKQPVTPGDDSENPIIKTGKEQIRAFKFAEAQTTFQQLAGADTIAEYYLGMLAAYYGKKDEAQQHFQFVVERDTNADATMRATRFLEAYGLFDTYQDGPPEFLDALVSKELLAAQEVELAVDKLTFITKNYPAYTDAWILLGSAYLIKDDAEQAIESLKHSLPSQKPEAYYWLGIAYLYQDNASKALASFKQAEKQGFIEEYKIHEKMGDSYVLLRQYRSAVTSYEQALEIESRYPDLYVRPVWIYIELLDEPDNALALAKQAKDMFPESGLAHNLLGWSYLAQSDYPRAKVALDRAKSLDPNLPALYLNFGTYYEAVESPDDALKAYEIAAKIDPEGSVGARAEDEYNRLIESLSQ